MRPSLAAAVLLALAQPAAWAHDIPNARVDRSIQVTLRPGRLTIDYEVSLSELTLTQDLRALIGTLPGAGRREWFEAYGRETGPLNARGLLVTVDGRPAEVRTVGYDLAVEEHPRYTFHYESDLPPRGRLVLRDTNFEASEGTSRLALNWAGGVVVRGDGLPRDVADVPIRPVWQLTDAEEVRTRRVEAEFEPAGGGPATAPPRPRPAPGPARPWPAGGLSRLLDRSGPSVIGLCLIAVAMGAAHALQPGHGKALVAAASVGGRGGWGRGVVLTSAHVGGVLALAVVLRLTESSRYTEIHGGLAHAAGFVIASVGLWRLGRHLGGFGEHTDVPDAPGGDPGARGTIALGLAGGVVPCWDAVVLLLLSEAVGRLALGLVLLSAFSLGMACVLVAIGMAAARLPAALLGRDRDGAWVRRLGLLSACVVTTIGLSLMST